MATVDLKYLLSYEKYYLLHPINLLLAHMISTALGAICVRKTLKMAHMVMSCIIYPTQTPYSETSKFNNTSIAHKIHLGGNPASIKQFPKVVDSFMIPSNYNQNTINTSAVGLGTSKWFLQ